MKNGNNDGKTVPHQILTPRKLASSVCVGKIIRLEAMIIAKPAKTNDFIFDFKRNPPK